MPMLHEIANGNPGTYRSAEIQNRMGQVEVLDKISTQVDVLLSRCLIGYCKEKNLERITLSDIRRWSSTNWKKAFGINIYELNDSRFLFEFLNRNMAEQRNGMISFRGMG